ARGDQRREVHLDRPRRARADEARAALALYHAPAKARPRPRTRPCSPAEQQSHVSDTVSPDRRLTWLPSCRHTSTLYELVEAAARVGEPGETRCSPRAEESRARRGAGARHRAWGQWIGTIIMCTAVCWGAFAGVRSTAHC